MAKAKGRRPKAARARPKALHGPVIAAVLAGLALAFGPDAFGFRPSAFGLDDPSGFREVSWSPDGRRLVASRWDRLWILSPDGREAAALAHAAPARSSASDRDPAWSPDGRSIAFASDRNGTFDVFLVSVSGGPVRRLTSHDGHERWPSWTRDNRLVFSRSTVDGQWDLYLTSNIDTSGEPEAEPIGGISAGDADELQAAVSPDGARIVFASDRENDDGDLDLWMTELPAKGEAAREPLRVTKARGDDRHPSWAPDGERVAHYAVREGLGSVWVTAVGRRRAGSDEPLRPRPASASILISRHGGVPSWSPSGASIVVAGSADPDPVYNGNPERLVAEPPPAFAGEDAYRLWTLPAPLRVDAATSSVEAASGATWGAAFDRVWETLRDLYYAGGASGDAWTRLRDEYRPRALSAPDGGAFEDVVDELVSRQPLIKSPVTSTRAVVVAGHPLAARAGALMLERGGNIVDAAIAVSFALGVVEPDASGIGGDGMALLFLRDMREPVAVDFKDQTPGHATLDNRDIYREGRLAGDGPAAANIPGVVAGMDLLYRRHASGAIPWSDLIAPAIEYAETGFVLDRALPSTVAAGRRYFQKYPEAARIYLPDGRVPRAGERFVNRDYAATLRAIAADAQSFYRGTIARRIAEDMKANGGIITYEDLAQYRAIVRKPVSGVYRGHGIFSAPPPVSSGASLIESLQILDFYRPAAGARYAAHADFLHYAIEAQKVRDRIRRISDPERWPVDLENHLTAAHAEELFRRIDPDRASLNRDDRDESERETGSRIGRGTTAFAVVDAGGNMIAVTQTLSTWGGAFYVSEGLGFLYNNHLRSNGTRPSQFGHLLPLMRSSTTSAPSLVFRRQKDRLEPRLAVAAAGNAWITASVYDIVLNVIDGGMGAQAAIEAPRFLVGRDPADPAGERARIQIEDRFPRNLLAELERRGHRFQKVGRKGEARYGYAAAAVVEPSGTVAGAAEPRRSHAVATPDSAGAMEKTGKQR